MHDMHLGKAVRNRFLFDLFRLFRPFNDSDRALPGPGQGSELAERECEACLMRGERLATGADARATPNLVTEAGSLGLACRLEAQRLQA